MISNDDFTKVKPYDYGDLQPMFPLVGERGKVHEALLKRVMDLARIAAQEHKGRTDSWDAMDKKLQACVDLTVSEKALKQKRPDIPVRVVIPYTYATLETLLTYLTMAFLSNDPVFQYDTDYAGSLPAVRLMQDVVQKQVVYYKAPLALYTCFRDSLAYGLGAVFPFWQKDFSWVKSYSQTMTTDLDGMSVPGPSQMTRASKLTFAGTKLKNVHPRYLLLDPSKSPHEIQSSSFAGWVEKTNLYALLEMERNNPEEWFNVRYIKFTKPSVSLAWLQDRALEESNDEELKVVYVTHLLAVIIPEEWELPAESDDYADYPEKWLFTIANDEVVIRAKRLDASHGKLPVALMSPDFDGYSQFPLSRLELSEGLQVTLDWLFNSHIKNVRQAINNRFVVDPMLINTEDLKNPDNPYIRLSESAWGKSVKDAIYQLGVTDVTQNHINNASSVIDMYQRITGATDGFMGIMRDRGERVSASESRSVTASGGNRMGKMALLMSFMGMTDIAMFYASNIADYQDLTEYVRITETHPAELQKRYGVGTTVTLNPGDLNIPFKVIPRDGSLPKDQQGIAQTWTELFKSISTNQILMQQYDVIGIFKYIAQLLGAKELPNFELEGKVMPDRQIEDGIAAGNMIPVEEVQGEQ